jgi:hypothetical protein
VSTVVSVMDRPGWDENTDNIVVVRPRRRELVFVPRDLWSTRYGRRVNAAFEHAGHEGLRTALREYGLRASHSICIQREAAGRLAERVDVEVPVEKPLRFRYQLAPLEPIEDGWRWIEFNPPAERLRGERVHQWLQARFAPDPFIAGDLRRIERQQTLIRVLLASGFDFGRGLDPDLVSIQGDPLADLRKVRPGWRMRTVGPVVPATIEGRKVILLRRLPGRLGQWELRRRVARLGGVLDP